MAVRQHNRRPVYDMLLMVSRSQNKRRQVTGGRNKGLRPPGWLWELVQYQVREESL